jgi:hypothetical protein
MISCNPMDKMDFHSHCLCLPAFRDLVLAFSKQEISQLVKSELKLKCPEPSCLRHFSDVDVARYAPEQIKEYVSAKLKVEEMKMSVRMKEELDRLQKMDAEQRETELLRRQIADGILNLSCPRCGQVFMDFNGCFALTCSRCNCGFCAWCFKDCGSDAHRHVVSCASNKMSNRAVFGDMELWNESNRIRIRKQVLDKLDSITDMKIKGNVIKAIEKELTDLGISLR